MDRSPQETRFTRTIELASPDTPHGEEVSLHRKSRRLDVVHQFVEPPIVFGPLVPWLTNRMVHFEHIANTANAVAIHASLGPLHTLAQRYRLPPSRDRSSLHKALRRSPRPPLGVLFARRMVRDPPVTLHLASPGIWATELDQDRAGLVVVEADRLPDEPGTGLLRWIPLPRSGEETELRTRALLGDPVVPTVLVARLLEELMAGQIPTYPEESMPITSRMRREWQAKVRVEMQDEVREEVLAQVRQEVRQEVLEEQKRERMRAFAELQNLLPPEAVAEAQRILLGEDPAGTSGQTDEDP